MDPVPLLGAADLPDRPRAILRDPGPPPLVAGREGPDGLSLLLGVDESTDASLPSAAPRLLAELSEFRPQARVVLEDPRQLQAPASGPRLALKIGTKAREVARLEDLQSRRPTCVRGMLLSQAKADLAALDQSQSA